MEWFLKKWEKKETAAGQNTEHLQVAPLVRDQKIKNKNVVKTGRSLDIWPTLERNQGHVRARMVSEWTFYIKKFSYKIIKKDLIWKYSETLLSFAGSWISTVHTMFNTVFRFLPDFSVWKRFGMVILVSWLDKSREKRILNRFEPFLTG